MTTSMVAKETITSMAATAMTGAMVPKEITQLLTAK